MTETVATAASVPASPAPPPDPPRAAHRFAVVACSACRQPWAVELRHATAACPHCRAGAELARRTRLWSGDDARAAQAAVAHHRAALAGGAMAVQAATLAREGRRAPRHDSPADAAAAQAAGIVNQSARAEAVALWMTRLVGLVPHRDLVDAMGKAGIATPRAEAEVVRLLATDVMVEPRAGSYRVLGA